MTDNLSFKLIFAVIITLLLLVFGYFKYQHKNNGVIVTIYPDYVDAKIKPTDTGGTISNTVENTIYERLQSKNKTSKTTAKTVNILPEPEQPININNAGKELDGASAQGLSDVKDKDNLSPARDDEGDVFDRVIAGNVPKQGKIQEKEANQQKSKDELTHLLNSMGGISSKQENLGQENIAQENKDLVSSANNNGANGDKINIFADEKDLDDLADSQESNVKEQQKNANQNAKNIGDFRDELKVVKVTGSTSKLELLDKGATAGYKIQLASVKSEAEGMKEFDRIKRKHQKILANTAMTVKKMYHDNGKVFYLVMAGNYNNSGQAKAVCKKLSQRGQNCIVEAPKPVKP